MGWAICQANRSNSSRISRTIITGSQKQEEAWTRFPPLLVEVASSCLCGRVAVKSCHCTSHRPPTYRSAHGHNCCQLLSRLPPACNRPSLLTSSRQPAPSGAAGSRPRQSNTHPGDLPRPAIATRSNSPAAMLAYGVLAQARWRPAYVSPIIRSTIPDIRPEPAKPRLRFERGVSCSTVIRRL